VRAAQISELGGTPLVADLPEPENAGRITVDVLAVALNPLDLAVAAGRFYGGHPPLPYVPGCEAVAKTADGSRVYVSLEGLGVARDGTLAGRATIAAERAVPVEEDVDDATAVALGIAGMTGWAAVKRGRVGPGDRVLVLGASGTSGSVAVQGAKLSGADRVVATGRNLVKLLRAQELGADETVALDGDLAAACGGDGPTVVIDPLWDGPVATAVEAAAPRARIVHYGQSAGPEATFKSATVRGKELELLGLTHFARTPVELRELHAELLGHTKSGAIRVDFKTFALEDVQTAWTHQAAGGKAVITI
jgi:NADPH2:quinone reductase